MLFHGAHMSHNLGMGLAEIVRTIFKGPKLLLKVQEAKPCTSSKLLHKTYPVPNLLMLSPPYCIDVVIATILYCIDVVIVGQPAFYLSVEVYVPYGEESKSMHILYSLIHTNERPWIRFSPKGRKGRSYLSAEKIL